MRRPSLRVFFLLTFGISWGVPGVVLTVASLTGAFTFSLAPRSPLSYLVIWAPAISALTVIGWSLGRNGLRGFVRRVFQWRADWRWSLAVIAGVPLATLLAGVLTEFAGFPWLTVPHASLGSFLMASLVVGTQGPVEEVGWRGFALPMLQQRHSGLAAAVILGFIWALWHVPGFFVESVMTGSMHGSAVLVQVQHFVGLTAKSVTMTVIFNASRGSIPLAFVFHWLSNLPYPWEAQAGISPAQPLLGVAVALVLVAFLRRRYLGTQALHTQLLAE